MNREAFEAWFKKERLSMMAHAKYLECWQAAIASQAQQESKPVIAHEVRAYGRMEKIIVRDDVAEEYADKLKADGYANVEVRELVYALPPAPEGE